MGRATDSQEGAATRGVLYATAAYVIWGFFPLYFVMLLPSRPWEVVAWRILFSFALCIVLVLLSGVSRELRVLTQRPSLLLWGAAAGGLIFINWQVFIIATMSERVVDLSLGYFLNPIVTVLLGVTLFRERLRLTEWIALGVSGVADDPVPVFLASGVWQEP